MKGPTFEVISKLMKAVVSKKITVPGSFIGHSGTPAVSCSYKAASGMIYPLERGFIFVYKPPIFIKFEEVKVVNFARSGGSNRSFDIEIHTRGETVYTFSSIEKDEYHRIYDFLKNKKVNVKSTGKMDSSKLDLSADNIDHFAETVKADADSDSDRDSMSSDDEDFNPDNLTAVDAKEEYDSDPSDTGSDTDEGSGSGSEGEKEKKRQVMFIFIIYYPQEVLDFFCYFIRPRQREKQQRRKGRNLQLLLNDPQSRRRRVSYLASLRNL